MYILIEYTFDCNATGMFITGSRRGFGNAGGVHHGGGARGCHRARLRFCYRVHAWCIAAWCNAASCPGATATRRTHGHHDATGRTTLWETDLYRAWVWRGRERFGRSKHGCTLKIFKLIHNYMQQANTGAEASGVCCQICPCNGGYCVYILNPIHTESSQASFIKLN